MRATQLKSQSLRSPYLEFCLPTKKAELAVILKNKSEQSVVFLRFSNQHYLAFLAITNFLKIKFGDRKWLLKIIATFNSNHEICKNNYLPQMNNVVKDPKFIVSNQDRINDGLP